MAPWVACARKGITVAARHMASESMRTFASWLRRLAGPVIRGVRHVIGHPLLASPPRDGRYFGRRAILDVPGVESRGQAIVRARQAGFGK